MFISLKMKRQKQNGESIQNTYNQKQTKPKQRKQTKKLQNVKYQYKSISKMARRPEWALHRKRNLMADKYMKDIKIYKQPENCKLQPYH